MRVLCFAFVGIFKERKGAPFCGGSALLFV
jgi:hypothetical protein